MISGNCNRSPQYNAMGPPGGSGQRYGPQVFVQQQPQHHPHLLLMAGGGTRGFPQMSRGFSMMPGQGGPMINGSHPKTAVFQCTMQNGFGNGFGFHPANAGPQVFHQQQQHHLYQQPQRIHYQHHQHQHQQHPQYVPNQYIPPPPVAVHTEPTSGFINGIKNMVKGIIHPLNCDFYSDHHKYYNPKYRNNYMMDLKSDNLCYMSSPTHPKQPEPHVKAVHIDLELNKPSVSEQKAKSTTQNESQKTREVLTIFNSEDFPELPAPRRSRSVTPPKKTETSSPPEQPCQQEAPASAENDTESSSSPSKKHPPPKGTFFEITIQTTPSGKRPTFGGRLKVVPPPFSLNKSPRQQQTNNSKSNSSANNKDCDIDEDSFVIFSNNEQPGECGFSSFRRPPRQRQISECSDDSFVVFFTEDADCVNGMQRTDFDDDDDDDGLDELYDSSDDSEEESSSEEEEEEEDDDCCDSSENGDDNGVDVVDSCFVGRNNHKTDKLNCDGNALKTATTTTSLLGVVPTNEHKQLDSGFEEKKVSFDPKQNVVHVMHVWNYAYRAARKGHWETIARDRDRFQERIERTSKYLNPVLTPEHREKIYRSRFCEEATNSMPQGSKNLKDELKSLLNLATGNCNEDSTNLPKLTKVPDCASF